MKRDLHKNTKRILSLSNISKTFYPNIEALKNIYLDIFEGDFLVLSGANGSGKTVLMHLIAGLDEPSSGKLVFYKDIKVGLVFQEADSQILSDIVEDDIAFGPKNAGLSKDLVLKKVDECLDWTQLTEKRFFSTRFLSGGEKRRLAVAGILALESDIFIFDEPFANLDWPGIQNVCKLIEKLKAEEKTIIVLTHELEKILAFANRFVVLQNGEKVFDGTVKEGLLPETLEKFNDWSLRNPLQSYTKKEDLHW